MKKQERLANKKRKLVALANIVEINETDKAMKNELTRDVDSKTSENMLEEPLQKKQKLKLSSETMTINQVLTDEQYNELKKELALKKNLLKNVPKMRLKFFGDKASLLTQSSKRTPLMLDDLQHLLMAALLGNSSPFKPDRWCVLEKANKITHSVVLVIEGLSGFTFSANESLFLKTKSIFEHQLEVVLPKYERGKIIQELSFVPLTQSYKDNLIRKFGSLEAAVNLTKDHHLISKSVFPIDSCSEEDSSEKELPEGETFPRTRLLLSPLQMMIEGYPLPLQGEFEEKFHGFTLTRQHYKPVSCQSPMFGLDCEMCRTVKGENELARVSIVNEKYESVYESLVRPDNKITDYLTQWSGITKEMMSDVTKTLKQVQNDVLNLLPADAILVGQSLNCDLNAMKIMHPYVIDTSVIYNITGDRNRKSKLQILAKKFLGEDIQGDRAGHSSIEDSTTSLKLTKLKLTQDIYYGDLALQVKRNIIEKTEYTGIVEEDVSMKSDDPQISTTIFSHAVKRMKKSAIMTTEKSDLDLEQFYSKNQFELFKNPGSGETTDEKSHGIKHHKLANIKNVISKTKEVIMDNDFNLSYLNLYEDSIDGSAAPSCNVNEEIVSELIPKIDKWIEKVWNSVASNGMFVVIFGGTPQNNNGLSMVQIKK